MAGALGMTTAALAQAPAQPVKGEAVVGTVQVSATVTKIDQASRQVTLKAEDGQEYSFVAGEDVKNLAQVKQGDVITATYTEAIAYEVKQGGTAKPASETLAAGAAAPGAKPAGAVAGQVSVTVKIAAIDTKTPSVTFKAANGQTRTIKVKDPQKLQGVNVGDTVELRYTEAIALKVERASK
jgi:Cu/Ag efflux protein CusF